MGQFLVECYRPGPSPGWLESASRAIDRFGASVNCRCVTSILVPEDGVAFFVVVGSSASQVLEVTGKAGVHADRVVRSVMSASLR